MPIIEHSVEVVLKDGQFVRRELSEVSLGSQDQLLAQLVEQQPVMLPRFMPFGDSSIHLHISKTNICYITELKQLPFTTWWAVDSADSTKLSPVFRQQRAAIEIRENWPVPPEFGKCLFILQMSRQSNNTATPVRCYLFLYKDKELYRLPYPNNYEDGRLCMGREWDNRPSLGKDMMSDFIHAHTSFHATSMNSDLVSESTFSVFQRNWDGWIWTDNNATFRRHCPKTVPAFLQGFVL